MSQPAKEYTVKNILRILRKLPKRDLRLLMSADYTVSEALQQLRYQDEIQTERAAARANRRSAR